MVRPYDEYQKWLGNKGVLLNGLFIHLLLCNMVAMLEAQSKIQDENDLLWVIHKLGDNLNALLIGFVAWCLIPLIFFEIWAKWKGYKLKMKKVKI